MKKYLYLFGAIILLALVTATYDTIYNPFTGTFDYVNNSGGGVDTTNTTRADLMWANVTQYQTDTDTKFIFSDYFDQDVNVSADVSYGIVEATTYLYSDGVVYENGNTLSSIYYDSVDDFSGDKTDDKYCIWDDTNSVINCTEEGGSGSSFVYDTYIDQDVNTTGTPTYVNMTIGDIKINGTSMCVTGSGCIIWQ